MSLKEILSEVTANDLTELGECAVVKFKIMLVDEKPIHIPPYRMSEAERRDASKEKGTLMDAGIIRQSRSPYSFPIIMVAKKDGTRKLCIDYRKLNAVTVSEPWPIRNIQDIFDKLSGSRIFTTLDLKSGCWQVRMHESSIAMTAFSTPDGHYEFTRLPFGLKNAPAEFSRIMFMILGDLQFIEIYIDDIIIHSEDMISHVEHVMEVLKRIKEANLKLNTKKCVWGKKEIEFSGLVISHKKIMMDPKKIKAIQERLAPKNVKQLQQFLGLTNYYRRFIKEYASLVDIIF